MNYTQEQIKLFDTILNFCIEKRQGNCSCNSFIQLYKTERQSTEFAYNEVCKISHEIGFFTSIDFGNGSWGIVSIDYSSAEKFKKDGGFAGYFKVKELAN